MAGIEELPTLNRILRASLSMRRAVPRDPTTKSLGPGPEAPGAGTTTGGTTIITGMREGRHTEAIERAGTLVPGKIEILGEIEGHTTITENINLGATLATETTVTVPHTITRAEIIITLIETTTEGVVDHMKTADLVVAIIDSLLVETRVATKPPITAAITKAVTEITKIDTLLATT